MFVDFNRVFKSKPQAQLSAPSALIDYMNRSLPEGVKYIVDENGDCVISSTNESYTIGGFTFRPSDEQKNILGKSYTSEDVLNYFYNVQKPIPMTLIKEGYILLNGQEFPIDKMAFNPLAPIKYVTGTFYMYPHKFPDPFSVNVGCNKYERSLLVSRVPHNSVSIAAFESSKEEPLYIQYFVDSKKQSLTMNISYNLERAKSIRDIVESTSIYNAFIDGNGTFLGHQLDAELSTKDIKKFDSNSILFWEKVLKIEDYLDISFIPPKDDVDFDTMCLVEQLYQNLINKTPTRDKQIINSIDGNWNFDSTRNDINESIGHPIFFEFEATSRIELFGVNRELPSLIGVFNATLQEYISKGKKQQLVLADESEEKKRYTSIMCFKTHEELKAYKTRDHDKMITLFHDAKRPHEYL